MQTERAQVIQLPTDQTFEELNTDPQPNGWDYALATLIVAFSTMFNIIGGWLFGSDLGLSDPMIGGAILAMFFFILEMVTVRAYVVNASGLTILIAEAFCVLAVLIGVQHAITLTVSSAEAEAKQLQEDRARYDSAIAKITEYDLLESQRDAKAKEVDTVKAKSVIKGTVWSDSQQCTLDNHPRDCAKITTKTNELARIDDKLSRIDRAQNVRTRDELLEKHPLFGARDTSINNESSNVQTTGVVEKLRALTARFTGAEVDLTTWILWASVFFAFALALAKRFSLKKVRPQDSYETSRSSGIRTLIKNSVKYPDQLVRHFLDRKARYAAELEQSRLDMAEARSNTLEQKKLNVAAYLQGLTIEDTQNWLEESRCLPKRADSKERVIRSVHWMLPLYVKDAPLNLRRCVSEVEARVPGSDLNYTYMQDTVVGKLICLGLVENRGTEFRAQYYWRNELSVIQTIKGE